MATTARADAPICSVTLDGAEQAPKMGWQMQHLCYTSEGVWERQPPPHMCTTNRHGHIFPHIQIEPWMLWAERTSREKGQSWEQLFLQHSTFCSMGFSAGILNSCFSLGKSALQRQHWQQGRPCTGAHRGDRKAAVGESSVCQEGESDTSLKWLLIWHSHLEKQI